MDALDGVLLNLEQAGTLPEDQSATLLRALHTLKGNSGMLGYTSIRDYVHGVESVFRTPPAEWTQALLDHLFTGAATLRHAVDKLGTEQEHEALARLAAVTSVVAPQNLSPTSQGGAPSDTQAEPAAAVEPEDRTPAAEQATGDAAPTLGVSTEMLRVPAEKLDALASQVTDLVGVHAALEAFLVENRVALDALQLRRPLTARVEELDRVADALRNAAADLRLVPIARVFNRFPSLARNLAHDQGKRINVVLEGEDTELDKSTVDVLAEPLLHLVRNAVDHGIGTPDRRTAAGKPPVGTITLRAAQRGDMVRIEVEDDGMGLDRKGIRERAYASGVIAPGEQLDHDEVGELIFRPGFSTRSEADTVSGRGIGMDIVANSVARLRGSVEVEDTPGQGTRFVLQLPLTLAVLPVLLFQSAGETLALAALDVEDTQRVTTTALAAGAMVIPHDEEMVPLARPAALFGWQGHEEPATPPAYAVLVRRGTRTVAIAADRLLEQRDVVVKPLPSLLGAVAGVSGATIAPDGRVVLLLDVSGVINLNLDFHRRSNRVTTSRQDPDR